MILPRLHLGLLPVLLLLLLPAVLAIQANLAGVVDWHKPLLGEPILEPTPPSLVETSQGRRTLVITKRNAFGAIDGSGQIVWRHVLEDQDPVVSYHVRDDTVLLLSGSSATTARLFSLLTGHVIWEQSLHSPSEPARLTVPVHLGTDATFTSKGDIVVLSDGRRVSKLDGKTGEVNWSLDAPGVGSTFLFKQIHVSQSSVHILALTSSFASQTLTTLSLSLDTSAPLNDLTQIPSTIRIPSDALIAASGVEGDAKVVWLERGKIHCIVVKADGSLGAKQDVTPQGKGKKSYTKMLSVGSRGWGFVLGQVEDGSVDIVGVRDEMKLVETFENSADDADKSPSVYSATKSTSGVVFNRIYWSFTMKMGACQTYMISTVENETITSGFTFPFDTTSNGVFLHAAPSSRVNSAQLVSIIVTTSSGALQVIEQEGVRWTREESLSDLAAVRFIDLGEPEVEQAGHVIEEEGFSGRLTRHLSELTALPAYIGRFASRLTSSSTTTLSTIPLTAGSLHRDQFGFQKLLVAITNGGKLFALDSSNGYIVWSRNLGLFRESGPDLQVEGMWVVRDHGDGGPVLTVLATRTSEAPETVAYHIDALTGRVAGDIDTSTGLPKGKVLFDGERQAAFLLPYENCSSKNRVLGVTDQDSKLHIFPFCKKLAGKIAAESNKLFYTTLDQSLEGPILTGHSPQLDAASPSLWSKHFNPHEVVTVNPAVYESISSFGKVKGDKSTLYKYLNPHLIVATAVSPSRSASASVSVINSITGRVVYEVDIADVDPSKRVIVTMVQNWLVYRWRDTNGWRLASVELYEDRSSGKAETPGLSSFASGHNITAYSQTFILSHEITSMAFTTSKAGITAKDLIYITSSGQIAHLPQRLLDPRRPTGKPTSQDREELLIPFDPLIPIEPKRIISHKYPIFGTCKLTSSPALLESTSLIFAHGLDLFLTRGLNPSGTFDILSESFNKAQLMLTLVGLSVGIAVAKPAVQRKMLGMKWF